MDSGTFLGLAFAGAAIVLWICLGFVEPDLHIAQSVECVQVRIVLPDCECH
jgi:hypothetical protein